MYTYFIYNGKEILIENERYYVLNSWQEETYNGKTYTVPVIDFEITEKSKYFEIKLNHLREKKLKRIIVTK